MHDLRFNLVVTQARPFSMKYHAYPQLTVIANIHDPLLHCFNVYFNRFWFSLWRPQCHSALRVTKGGLTNIQLIWDNPACPLLFYSYSWTWRYSLTVLCISLPHNKTDARLEILLGHHTRPSSKKYCKFIPTTHYCIVSMPSSTGSDSDWRLQCHSVRTGYMNWPATWFRRNCHGARAAILQWWDSNRSSVRRWSMKT